MTVLVADHQPTTTSPYVVRVAMGECAVAGAPARLRTVGVGSCLVIVIFAPVQQLAALAHCMLPERLDDDGEPSKYVNTAVPSLLASLRRAGATEPFSATLVGGASMFPGLPAGVAREIGRDNIAAARAMLTNSSIPVRSEDVGGHVGRSVLVDPATQQVVVSTMRDKARCL